MARSALEYEEVRANLVVRGYSAEFVSEGLQAIFLGLQATEFVSDAEPSFMSGLLAAARYHRTLGAAPAQQLLLRIAGARLINFCTAAFLEVLRMSGDDYAGSMREQCGKGREPGYHTESCPIKGTYGSTTKIKEETWELEDAIKQNNRILVGCEAADIVGAVAGVAEQFGYTLQDLVTMAEANRRAFQAGER